MDPIANMLTQIRNAQAVTKESVLVPFSRVKYQIAKILEKHGFTQKTEKKGKGAKANIKISLKYQEKKITEIASSDQEIKQEIESRKEPAIIGARMISKPGQRIYLPAKKIRPVRGGFGIAIISTSKGIMIDKEARKKKIGGEIICEVW